MGFFEVAASATVRRSHAAVCRPKALKTLEVDRSVGLDPHTFIVLAIEAAALGGQGKDITVGLPAPPEELCPLINAASWTAPEAACPQLTRTVWAR
jgi:hypothetical protein